MNGIIKISRRDFLKVSALAGGGLILGFSFPFGKALGDTATPTSALVKPNAFIRIGADETVTIIVNHSEMGEGVYTSLSMLVAEELEADWSKIRVEAAPVDPVYNHTAFGMQMTGGSSSVWSEYDRLREVGAAAREMLISAAAAEWHVDRSSCRAANGKVKTAATYGHLADAATWRRNPGILSARPPGAEEVSTLGPFPVRKWCKSVGSSGSRHESAGCS